MANLTLMQKLSPFQGASTLELSVAKTGGPVATRAEVGSSGTDDWKFSDKQLTPGPAVVPLNPANSYTIVWRGAFVKAGTATLRLRVLDPQGGVVQDKTVPVKGAKGDVFFRVRVLP